MDQLSTREAAVALGISEGSVKRYVYDGVRKLGAAFNIEIDTEAADHEWASVNLKKQGASWATKSRAASWKPRPRTVRRWAVAPAAQIAASIIGPARRRRRVRGAMNVTGAIVTVAAFTGGSFAVVNAFGSTDASPAIAMSTSSPTAQPQASPNTPTEPSASNAQDGSDVYPPLAASHGEEFPSAYEMREWVWDYVGTGWSLESDSQRQDPYTTTVRTVPSAAVYLVSPEGAHFEVSWLAQEQSAGMRVMSWQKDDRSAHIEWGDVNGLPSTGGAVLDLTSGSVLPLVLPTPWGVSSTVAPLAVTANGSEMWAAWLEAT